VEEARPLAADVGQGCRLDAQPEADAQADGPQRPDRIAGDGVRAAAPQHAILSVAQAVEGVDDVVPGVTQRRSNRIQGEVAPGQIGQEIAATEVSNIDNDALSFHLDDGPPGLALRIERVEGAIQSVGDTAGDAEGIPGDGQVDVMRRQPPEGIAHHAADQIDFLLVSGEKLLQGMDDRRPAQRSRRWAECRRRGGHVSSASVAYASGRTTPMKGRLRKYSSRSRP